MVSLLLLGGNLKTLEASAIRAWLANSEPFDRFPHLLTVTVAIITTALADRSLSSYAVGIRAFLFFIMSHMICTPFPPSTSILLAFVSFEAYHFRRSHKSLKQYLSGIKHLCSAIGASTDGFNSRQLELQLRGLHRLQPGATRKPRVPITIWVLQAIHGLLSFTNYNHVLIWAALTCAVCGLLRAGEITYKDVFSVILRRTDVTWFPNHVVLHIRESKTDIFRLGVRIFLFRIPTSFCPFTALHTLWHRAPDTSPLAPAFQTAQGTPLLYSTLLAACKNLLLRLNFDPTVCGTQSCRIGGATTLALLGFPATTIQTLGRWRSNCYRRYLRLRATDFQHIYNLFTTHSSRHTGPFGRLSLDQVASISLKDISSICSHLP